MSGTGVALCTPAVNDSTGVSWESVYNISHSWVDLLILYVLLFESCIWPDVTSRQIQQRVCLKSSGNLGKYAMEILAMIRQAFGEESMSHAWMFEWKSSNSPRPKKGETGTEIAHHL
jgi:hypothetical protein